MKVISLLGEPGSGKSVTALDLTSTMKKRGYSVELAAEYAKELVHIGHAKAFKEQDYILAEQNRRLRMLIGNVEYAVTDSPLFLSTIYVPENYVAGFLEYSVNLFNSYENINFLMKRNHAYQKEGRLQKEQESEELRAKLIYNLEKYKVPYHVIQSGEHSVDDILKIIEKNQGLK